VQRYNEYRMFLCPEEVVDLPSIGFVEGMACGAAFIGIRDPMYSDIGLIDKVHYIGYDGTLQDILKKIAYYQKNEQELEQIAEAGYNFVRQNFNGPRVAKEFLTYLEGEVIARKGRK
jgi:glycosyltransferase involved in cell wall biosynthesis